MARRTVQPAFGKEAGRSRQPAELAGSNPAPLTFPKPSRPKKAPRRLTRKTWMRKRAPRRLQRAGSDPVYLDFVRSLPCAVEKSSGLYRGTMALVSPTLFCEGRIHAHHAIHRSQGGKDDSAVPLCDRHHRQWHDANGVFAGLSRLERFAWAQRAIARTQAAYRWQR